MKKTSTTLFPITVFSLLMGCSVTSANSEAIAAQDKANTPVLTKPKVPSTECADQIEGDWDYGTAPAACNVNSALSLDLVQLEYSPVILDETQIANGARFKYMSVMYTVVRDTASYYIHRRNPQVTSAEVDGFLQGVFALVSQESKWTHFRNGVDGITRFMRGDRLHGYGLMQVDDRSFLTDIKQGLGADLVGNMMFGLDLYYSHWMRALTTKCVSSPTNFKDRARAAWAAYNGGEGAICRWSKKKSRYASHDRSYNDRYTKQAWRTYVADENAPAPLNVRCLAEGSRPCVAARGASPTEI